MNGARAGNGREQIGADRVRVRSVAPACLALYLAVVVGLLFTILHRDDRVFTYTLDDPYIHLALAEQLAHGHYGINAGEASSPSSSIVWPLLLTPFAGHAWDMYLPLVLNVVFCGLAAWLIGWMVDRWADWLSWGWRFAIAASLMLVANLVGLTFVGMEHGLQVLLAVVCAAGVLESFAGRKIPAWCVWAAALGPMVRYENFALVAAVAVALYGQGHWRAAMRLVGLSVVGPVLFSAFLLSRGLPALPTSVLVKAKVYSLGGGATGAVLGNMYGLVVQEGAWWGLLAVALVLLILVVRERQRARRFVLGGALLAAMLQLAVGRFNWFHRYEVYAVVFTALTASAALVEMFEQIKMARVWCGVLIAGLLALGGPYAWAIWQTPDAASNVYQQQYQMHRFVADFYGKTVAVNDLGWVSYWRLAGVDVLDLWGLASPEASRQKHKDAAWLDAITRKHGAGLAILYPDWYEDGVPDDWTPLATMCATSPLTSVAYACVVFYDTGVGGADNLARLTAEIAAFAKTLPGSVKMTLGKDTSERDD